MGAWGYRLYSDDIACEVQALIDICLFKKYLRGCGIQGIYNPHSVVMSMTGHDRTTTFSESEGISVSMQL